MCTLQNTKQIYGRAEHSLANKPLVFKVLSELVKYIYIQALNYKTHTLSCMQMDICFPLPSLAKLLINVLNKPMLQFTQYQNESAVPNTVTNTIARHLFSSFTYSFLSGARLLVIPGKHVARFPCFRSLSVQSDLTSCFFPTRPPARPPACLPISDTHPVSGKRVFVAEGAAAAGTAREKKRERLDVRARARKIRKDDNAVYRPTFVLYVKVTNPVGARPNLRPHLLFKM
jgi:hypothetical protein